MKTIIFLFAFLFMACEQEPLDRPAWPPTCQDAVDQWQDIGCYLSSPALFDTGDPVEAVAICEAGFSRDNENCTCSDWLHLELGCMSTASDCDECVMWEWGYFDCRMYCDRENF